METDFELIKAFAGLFDGNKRSFGQYRGNAKTVKEEYSMTNFADHLSGRCGLGIVPIRDDSCCSFAVIDIDCHKEGQEPPDLNAIEETVKRLGLPLNVCRSKSGGAHVYMFLDRPTRAALVTRRMKDYAGIFGYKDAEIFPKQNSLKSGHLGNWINLPYFDEAETQRYCVRDGKKLTLAEFLQQRRIAAADQFSVAGVISTEDAPPCIASMIENGIEKGYRNESLYACGVYLKKRYPEDWRVSLKLLNEFADQPLSEKEIGGVVNSLTKKDYAYRCNADPCSSLCNRSECEKRKFGIKSVFSFQLPITKLVRLNTEPPTWRLTVDGQHVLFDDIDSLLSYRAVRARVAEQMKVLLPTMKNEAWEMVLEPLLKECQDEEAPTSAASNQAFYQRLIEFIKRSGAMSTDLENPDDRVYSGGCRVLKISGDLHVIFNFYDYCEFLRKQRVSFPANMWVYLSEAGVRKWADDLCVIKVTEDMKIRPAEGFKAEF